MDVKTSYKGRVGSDLKIVFPKAINGKAYYSTTPAGLPAHTSNNTNTYKIETTFPDDLPELTFVYKGTSLSQLTIKFVLASNSKEMVRKDFTSMAIPTEYVQSIVVEATTGESIQGILDFLQSSGRIKLDYAGYKPLTAKDYKSAEPTKPSIVNKDMTIYYEYEGAVIKQ